MNSETSVPIPDRTTHPFWMYEMIRTLPESFRVSVEQSLQASRALEARKTFFVGCGTAYYAGAFGTSLLKNYGASFEAYEAFEFTQAKSQLKDSLVVGISHSGVTKTTLEALRHAQTQGSSTLGVTHYSESPITSVARKSFVIGPGPDRSRCHTRAYVDATAAVLVIGSALLELSGAKAPPTTSLYEEVESALRFALAQTEETAKLVARDCRSSSKMFIAGVGPSLVNSREAALKLKESSYVTAEGIGLEELIHGPWMTFDSSTLVIAIDTLLDERGRERVADLVTASKIVGAKTWVVGQGGYGEDYTVNLRGTSSTARRFAEIIPLYYFAYYSALERGNNPDFLRYLEPSYWKARGIVFPPGTH